MGTSASMVDTIIPLEPLSLWCYRYLQESLDFDIEMKNMTLELANALTAIPRQRHA